MYGEPYWCEDAYYQFTLAQIEELEEATAELNRMCLQVVDKVVNSEALLTKFRIPATPGTSCAVRGCRASRRSMRGWIWLTTARARLNCWKTTPIPRRRCTSRRFSVDLAGRPDQRRPAAAARRPVQQPAGKADRTL